jgi:hypothetical protein
MKVAMRTRRYHTPGDNVLAALVREDPRYLSNDQALHRALLKELQKGGFHEDFIAERFPKLRLYLREVKKPQRLASASRAV